MFTPYFLNRYPDHLQRHWRRDSHWGRVGYRWFAEALSDYFQRTEMLTRGPVIWDGKQ